MSNARVTNLKGERGSRYLAGSGTLTGPYEAITALEASTVTVVAANNPDTMTAIPIPAGCTIFMKFTTITWVSGKMICYVGENLT